MGPSPEVLSFALHYGVVSRRPRILMIAMGTPDPGFKRFAEGDSSVAALCRVVGSGGHLLISPWWNMAGPPAWQQQLAQIGEVARVFSESSITFLCNAPEEVPVVEAYGLNALFLNHNAFVQEAVFDIASEPKLFRAIYIAKLAAMKRHELAAKTAGLALIYARWHSENYQALSLRLPGAAFLNGDPTADGYRFFDGRTVARYINQARVGLCLSAEEGAMFASMEYLLCGLPLVSTPSRGGRDVFFDPDYCAVVPPDADAVSEAVTELIARALDPAVIRARTLEKVAEHRQRFVEFVDGAQAAAGYERTGRAELARLLTSPWTCYTYGTIANIVRELAQ